MSWFQTQFEVLVSIFENRFLGINFETNNYSVKLWFILDLDCAPPEAT